MAPALTGPRSCRQPLRRYVPRPFIVLLASFHINLSMPPLGDIITWPVSVLERQLADGDQGLLRGHAHIWLHDDCATFDLIAGMKVCRT